MFYIKPPALLACACKIHHFKYKPLVFDTKFLVVNTKFIILNAPRGAESFSESGRLAVVDVFFVL